MTITIDDTTIYGHAYAWAYVHQYQPTDIADAYGKHFVAMDAAGEVTVLTTHEREWPEWRDANLKKCPQCGYRWLLRLPDGRWECVCCDRPESSDHTR